MVKNTLIILLLLCPLWMRAQNSNFVKQRFDPIFYYSENCASDSSINRYYFFYDLSDSLKSDFYISIQYNKDSSLNSIHIPYIDTLSSVISYSFDTYKNGVLKHIRFRYLNNVEFGPDIDFYENGMISRVYIYKNNLMDFKEQKKSKYDFSGDPVFCSYGQREYIKDRNGYEYYFDRSGNILFKGLFKDDARVGFWKIYNDSMMVVAEGEFESGLPPLKVDINSLACEYWFEYVHGDEIRERKKLTGWKYY